MKNALSKAKKLRLKAIGAFKKQLIDDAYSLFCLAYESLSQIKQEEPKHKKLKEELLLFIELCDLAKSDSEGVCSLFDIYTENLSQNQEENLRTILEILELTNERQALQINSANGVNYSDFLDLIKAGADFGQTFENIIHSSRIVISSQDELGSFLANLIEHGYNDLALHYFEDRRIALAFAHLAQKIKPL